MSPLLEARKITKSFPGVKALDDVSLLLHAGQVHALIGENGAGKSTLISLLTGVTRPDEGQLLLRGKPISLATPTLARQHGIAAIFQELSIVPWLDVAANIVLGNEPGTSGCNAFLSSRKAAEISRKALARLGVEDIPVDMLANKLSAGQKQLVEIARVLALNPSIIIMDEPTSSLPRRDAEKVLEIVRLLRADGKAIVFVSHRLDEVMQVADKVTVLRGGQNVTTVEARDVTTDKLIEAMIGRKIEALFPPRQAVPQDVLLNVRGLTSARAFQDISFDLHRGEILGFYGLIGAGRTEVMRAIFGVEPAQSGHVEMEGIRLTLRSPADAIAAGIFYLPEDRKDHGLVLPISGRENIVLSTLKDVSRFGIINARRLRELTSKLADKVGVKGNLDRPVVNLSGGNQQKIIIARGLVSNAHVLIFDEPTRGIDIGAKYEIYCLIQELAANGAAVILVSSELPEITHVANRAIVMSAGKIYGEFDQADFDERAMLAAAFAGFRTSPATEQPKTQPARSHQVP